MIRRLSACCALIAVSGFSADAVEAQEKTILRASGMSPAATCDLRVLDDSQPFPRSARLGQRTYGYVDEDCASIRHNHPLEQPSRALSELHVASADPVEDELGTMGTSGFLIGPAREEVAEILREGNSCSVWYGEAEPDLVAKFASLHFQVDEQGADTMLWEFNSGEVSYRQPYVARAQENVGRGSVITLNAHGAFFQSRAPAKFRLQAGGPFTMQPSRLLYVAGYAGGSLNAQVTTLLHEFGHIVGILPIDSGEPRSALLSTLNTDTLLRHCRKQIEASRDRAILMPASLAALEQSAKER
jgi:hypothetical protein